MLRFLNGGLSWRRSARINHYSACMNRGFNFLDLDIHELIAKLFTNVRRRPRSHVWEVRIDG